MPIDCVAVGDPTRTPPPEAHDEIGLRAAHRLCDRLALAHSIRRPRSSYTERGGGSVALEVRVRAEGLSSLVAELRQHDERRAA